MNPRREQVDWRLFRFLLRRGHWRKAVNYLAVQLQYAWQTPLVWGKPYYLCFDPALLCNLKCPLCLVGRDEFPKPKELMEWDTFRRVMDTLGPCLLQMDIFMHGEPTLNRNLYEMIRYSKRYNVTVKMSTNLQVVDPKRLVESGLDDLIVSADGITQESYEKYRVGGRLEKVITNLKGVLDERRRQGRKTPRVRWKFIVFRHNEHEIEDFKKLAAELGVDDVDLHGAIVGDPPLTPEMMAWVPRDPRYSLYGETDVKYEKSLQMNAMQTRCNWPWIAVALDPRGNVKTCCHAVNPEEDFGNILKEDFHSVWHGKDYKASRAHIGSGKALVPHAKNICEKCTVAGVINILLDKRLILESL